MLTDDRGSAVPRRILGRELRNLRLQAGLTTGKAAKLVDRSDATMWRYESGLTSVRVGDVLEMCRVYGAKKKLTDVLIALAGETKAKGWWHSLGDVIPEGYDLYLGFESAAEQIATYESELVPGLMQTEDYARAFIGSGPGRTEAETDHLVRVRMNRQLVLTRAYDPVRFRAVINEGALHRPTGGRDAMANQLAHLIELSERPNVALRIMPLEVGYHVGMDCGPVTLFEFAERPADRLVEPPIAYGSHMFGELFLDKPREIARIQQALREVAAATLDEKQSRTMLVSLEKEMRA